MNPTQTQPINTMGSGTEDIIPVMGSETGAQATDPRKLDPSLYTPSSIQPTDFIVREEQIGIPPGRVAQAQAESGQVPQESQAQAPAETKQENSSTC